YSSTQMPAGLSDRMTFVAKGGDTRDYHKGAAGQKAYQATGRTSYHLLKQGTVKQRKWLRQARQPKMICG
ncbi:MAG: hypothetical protein ACPGVP_17895, partial [Thiolinea sp.]